jgi:DNA-binding GntR family transcriptional regulator
MIFQTSRGTDVATRRVQAEYRTKTDLVASAIKDMIHSGELEPGATLRQRDIADQLGVSPTPVREALRRLEAEGYVLYQTHSSAVVVRSEDAAVYENALIRAVLESLGTRLATRKVTPGDIEDLEKINEEFLGAGDRETAVALNRAFHFRIYEIAASPVLRAQLNLLWRMLDGGPRVDRPREVSYRQHGEIIEAMRASEAERAGELVRHHILELVPVPEAT